MLLFLRHEANLMNTPSSSNSSLENLNVVATVSSILAGVYFVAVNFLF